MFSILKYTNIINEWHKKKPQRQFLWYEVRDILEAQTGLEPAYPTFAVLGVPFPLLRHF